MVNAVVDDKLGRFGAPCQVAIRWTFAPQDTSDIVRVELARVVNWRTDDVGGRWVKVELRPADTTKLWVPRMAIISWETPHPDINQDWGKS